jgi:hypothetical protein
MLLAPLFLELQQMVVGLWRLWLLTCVLIACGCDDPYQNDRPVDLRAELTSASPLEQTSRLFLSRQQHGEVLTATTATLVRPEIVATLPPDIAVVESRESWGTGMNLRCYGFWRLDTAGQLSRLASLPANGYNLDSRTGIERQIQSSLRQTAAGVRIHYELAEIVGDEAHTRREVLTLTRDALLSQPATRMTRPHSKAMRFLTGEPTGTSAMRPGDH